MEINAVGWFEIYVEDIDRAKKFYETVFDLKLEKLPENDLEMWSFPMRPESYGAPGALVKMAGFETGNNSVLVYFSCQNCAIEEKRALQNGGKIQKPKFSIGKYGFISHIRDTESNMIGLHSHK